MAYNREDMITWNELAPSLQTVLKGYESGIEALNQKYQAEHLSLTDVETNLATMIQNLSQATAQMQESLDELVSTQNEAKSGIGTLNSTQTQMRTDLENAASSIKEGIDACGEIEKTIRSSCSSIDEQIQELNETQGAIRSLCSNLDVNVKDELDTLNATCSQLESTARTIKTNGSTLSQTCDRIESVTNAINSALSSLNSTESDVSGYCASLESSARNIAATLTAVSQTVAILSNTCTDVDTSCKTISSAMTTLNNSTRSIDTSAASLDATCKTISTTCLEMKNVLDSILTSLNLLGQSNAEARSNMNSNHVEIKALLESIKQNGTGGGGGTTPTPEVVFNLSDVEGAVEEFGSLTEEEQILANAYKKNGKTDEQIITWLRAKRSDEVVFNLADVEGAVDEFGSLTEEEQILANNYKKNGKTNDEIIEWLRNYRNSQTPSGPDPDEEFDITKVSGGSDYAPLTEEEQSIANNYKKAGKTDEEILAWLIEYRESQPPVVTNPVFNLSDVEGAVKEFGSLTEEEQILANAYKKNGKTNDEIIAWLRAKRLLEAVFNISDVEGAVEEFGSLTEEEQTLANDKKRSGQSDEEIIAWLREKRSAEASFNLSDVEGAVEEFGSLTEEEQILANAYKKNGQTNDQIIEWLRAKRLAESTFNLSDVDGAVEEFGSLTEEEQTLANGKKRSGQSNDEIITWLRAKRLAESMFNLADVEGAVDEFGFLTEEEQTLANSYKRAGQSNDEIIAWLRAYRDSLVFKLSDVPGATEEFVELSQEEQEEANSMRKNGKTNEEVVAYLRSARAAYDGSINNYTKVTDVGAELDVHMESVEAHRSAVKSSRYMMHHANTSYEVGDVVRIGELPTHMALFAQTKGVTATSRPDFAAIVGSTEGVTSPSKDLKVNARTAAIRDKISAGSTTVNEEILALHREVYDHEYDPNAHDLTSTSRFVHKTNHTYTTARETVFANNLPPHLMLEVYQTGTTAETAPGIVVKGRSIPVYEAPTITVNNREQILDGIESEFAAHTASEKAHNADIAEYLFDTNSSGYQVIPYGNSCYLCALVS